MSKHTKADKINEAIARSASAVDKQAKAEIVEGLIVYSIVRKGAYVTTRIRVTLMDILYMLNGADVRAIKSIA